MMALLKVEQVETYIGQHHILQGLSFEANAGEITVLFGRNGAGKTTTLRTVMGMLKPSSGRILFEGRDIGGLPTYQIARLGIGYVPEDQGLFADLTVEENMKVALVKRDAAALERLEWMLELFPDLRKFWHRKSGLLSGGQKQMLAIARAYIKENKLLLIDEPSKGLAPIMVEKVMEAILRIKERISVVLVEQNFMMASRIGDTYYIIDDGKVVRSGGMQEIREDSAMRTKYLGIA
jgi:branched-chain amino acid transport system ATP-binding protein